MLNTPPQNKPHKHLNVFNTCEQSCIMMIMGGCEMSKNEYDLQASVILTLSINSFGITCRFTRLSRSYIYIMISSLDSTTSINTNYQKATKSHHTNCMVTQDLIAGSFRS